MVMEESTLTSDNIEMCSITKGANGKGCFHMYNNTELDTIIKESASTK